MNPDDVILISVDDHIAEPADMFDAHLPAKYKEFAPEVRTDERGIQQWWYGNVKGRNLGLNAVAGKSPEFFNVDASRYDEMRPGCYDVHERVRDMNAGGQLAGLNFPNFTGFSGQVLNQGPDPDVNEVMIRAYNDWHIDEWCGAYPGRFIPCGILPLFDVERAAAEVRRLASKGCHAVTFSENPEALNMPSIHSGQWDPLFAACVETETVLACHLGSSSRPSFSPPDAPAGVNMSTSSAATIYTLVDLVWATFWERFPTLKFSLTEGDIGWIPYFLWRSEHVRERHGGWTKHDFSKTGGPTQIFKDHVLVCFIKETIFPKLLDDFNVDNICWESDYPHSDSTWPDGPEEIVKSLAGLSDDLINKITYENAMKHYSFDPFAHRPREQCTAGALRAESPDVDTVTRVGRAASDRDLEAWRELTGARR
ncbi:MAG: amidohydrolase family protein [Acidimicrobiales bacterium]|nr:amidohydrolase family protein [Acidimicrobiales bacterium]